MMGFQTGMLVWVYVPTFIGELLLITCYLILTNT